MSTDRISYDHLNGCVKAYLRGKQTLNWVMSFIKGHKLPPSELASIIRAYKDAFPGPRYDELWSICIQQGFASESRGAAAT